jgi:hypothetical protein
MLKTKLDKNGLKQCTKCNQKKTLEEYHNLKSGRYGKCSYCKECAKNCGKEWVGKNRDKINKRYNKNSAQRRKSRMKKDKDWYFRCILSNQVRRYIIDKKGKHTEDILGETFDNVRLHIEKQFKDGMSWDNFGEWHIDHIIPLSSGKNEEEIIKLNHYTNLQPLWAEENLAKGARLDWVEEGGRFSSPQDVVLPRAFSTNHPKENTILKEDEWCHYGGLPSPKAYMD